MARLIVARYSDDGELDLRKELPGYEALFGDMNSLGWKNRSDFIKSLSEEFRKDITYELDIYLTRNVEFSCRFQTVMSSLFGDKVIFWTAHKRLSRPTPPDPKAYNSPPGTESSGIKLSLADPPYAPMAMEYALQLQPEYYAPRITSNMARQDDIILHPGKKGFTWGDTSNYVTLAWNISDCVALHLRKVRDYFKGGETWPVFRLIGPCYHLSPMSIRTLVFSNQPSTGFVTLIII
ncbi:hypothetical protein BDV95DRAFT_605942 [Massariosphaeria phaeospora]|uniref:Uncharacterized protein n=1 Tax=Massariosphaeria phaeospora TaxID=100035 RepID=A0A7C8MB91_9PLEO|nr:hypothetical protein BDV95DRAFT_605942 [Massariosphaeria phaeospora]